MIRIFFLTSAAGRVIEKYIISSTCIMICGERYLEKFLEVRSSIALGTQRVITSNTRRARPQAVDLTQTQLTKITEILQRREDYLEQGRRGRETRGKQKWCSLLISVCLSEMLRSVTFPLPFWKRRNRGREVFKVEKCYSLYEYAQQLQVSNGITLLSF